MDALKKFMDSMGVEVNIKIDRTYNNAKGVCIRVELDREGQIEYLQYHCYSKKKDGSLKYEEGNEVVGIHQGVLSYLGMDREIDNYFDNKCREIAKRYLR